MTSNTNLFSIKQLQIKGNISMNLSKTYTSSKKQLQLDGIVSSESLVKNSLKQTSSKFKKHKQSIQTVESLSKFLKDQQCKIQELRKSIREQKNSIAQKKIQNYKIIKELKNQIVGLERQNQNYKHNSSIRVNRKEKEVEEEFNRIELGKTKAHFKSASKFLNLSKSQSIFSQHQGDNMRASQNNNHQTQRGSTENQINKLLKDKQNLFVSLESQHVKQVNFLKESMSKTQKYANKIDNISKQQSILKSLYSRYEKNRKVINDIQKVLFKRENGSKLLRKKEEIDWNEFPILQEYCKKQNSFYSSIRTRYNELGKIKKKYSVLGQGKKEYEYGY